MLCLLFALEQSVEVVYVVGTDGNVAAVTRGDRVITVDPGEVTYIGNVVVPQLLSENDQERQRDAG